MNNVYALVEHFYEHQADAEKILAQDFVERYLRRHAWHGADDSRLRRIWMVLSLLVTYVEQTNLYGVSSLSLYDYQELLYRLAQADKDFQLDEEHVKIFFDVLEDFARYYQKTYGEEEGFADLREARESVYDENDRFVMPPRRSQDEFYSSLNHQDDVTEEDVDKLNNILDDLLHRIGNYFHRQEFERDLNRALMLYSGPDYITESSRGGFSEENETFWLSFWDYFLFDYHMLATDKVPMRYFFERERNNLTMTQQDIIRDLLKAKFTVFYIESMGDGFVSCCNLFTEECLELPADDFMFPEVGNMIFFGHLHASGVMMLNYVTSLPASHKLRQRMKDIILRQLDLFRCQQPDATLDDFFRREAVAVRHTLHIMATFAQLNVVPLRQVPKPLPVNPDIRQSFEEEEEVLRQVALRMGFSLFSTSLICKLFEDYMSVADPTVYPDEMPAIVTACLLCYGSLNGMDFKDIPELYELFGAKADDVRRHMATLRQRLHCINYDPRYLTEEGFVTSLYLS